MNPLQDLKDIRTPAAIESWPPAYGWWLLVVLVLIGLGLLIICLIKRRKVRLAKRQALQTLRQIDSANLDAVSQLNQLLKRVAITYFPNQNVQEMYGPNWTTFLVSTLPNNKVKNCSGSFKLMQQALYQPHNSQDAEYSSYHKSVETWIMCALPPNKKVFTQLEQNNA